MSFLFGRTEQRENIPADIRGLRSDLAGTLQGALPGYAGGLIDPFFLERIVGPTQRLFTQQRSEALAQAKESAGNLTGSGFANILGGAVNRSLAQEQATIADLINRERERVLGAILGFSTAGVAPPTTTFTPGLLDYLAGGATAAAPFAPYLFKPKGAAS